MDKRLHSRLANPQKYIMPTYRINNAWKREEARIISEQAQKDALQQQATQEAARAIAKLERQEAERNPWIAASKMTAIQGINRANNLQTRRNEEENNIESWANDLPTRMNTTQPSDANIDDSTHNSWVESSNNATNANNLIGSWRNGYRVPAIDIGNSNQFARLASGYGDNHQYTSEGTVAPGVGIDDIEGYEKYLFDFVKENRDEIERGLDALKETAKEKMPFDIFQFIMLNVPMPPNGKAFMIMALLILAICECAETATQKQRMNVRIYMAKHNCSQEEAEAHISYWELLFAEVGCILTEEWVAKTLQVLGMPKQIAEKFTYLCFAALHVFDKYRRMLDKERYGL